MRKVTTVTFDTNVWQMIVEPDSFKANRQRDAACVVRAAIERGEIEPFLSSTVVNIEAVPKRVGARASYLFDSLNDRITIETNFSEDGRISGTVSIGGTTDVHPGISPTFRRLLKSAFELGFKWLPTPRLGSLSPTDFEEFQCYMGPSSPEEDFEVWQLDGQQLQVPKSIQRTADACARIEEMGYGFAVVLEIARQIQRREGLPDVPWFMGLNRAKDHDEAVRVSKAFAEWADGDSVAAHIGNCLDIFCTEDRHGGRQNGSIFSKNGRSFLQDELAVQLASIEELATEFCR